MLLADICASRLNKMKKIKRKGGGSGLLYHRIHGNHARGHLAGNWVGIPVEKYTHT